MLIKMYMFGPFLLNVSNFTLINPNTFSLKALQFLIEFPIELTLYSYLMLGSAHFGDNFDGLTGWTANGNSYFKRCRNHSYVMGIGQNKDTFPLGYSMAYSELDSIFGSCSYDLVREYAMIDGKEALEAKAHDNIREEHHTLD